jgi:protein phosphatase/serine/threonine-protein phosphatase Stp1
MSSSEMEISVAEAGPFRSWGASHRGTVRGHNEDRFVNRPDLGLWAVADGAGGHDLGQAASSLIAAKLAAIAPGLGAADLLAEVRERLADAHAELRAQAEERGGGSIIASTVVVLLARDNYYAFLWVGDSRGYLLRDGLITQVTKDHSLVQELVDAGVITCEQMEGHPHANVITRAIGADADELEIDKVTGALFPGDRLLLCSDGISKLLSIEDLAGVLVSDEDSPAERLILGALTRHANDNVTAVTIEVVDASRTAANGGVSDAEVEETRVTPPSWPARDKAPEN